MTLFCGGNHMTHILVTIAYIQCIALICGVYAFKARCLPETFNEARYVYQSVGVFNRTSKMGVQRFFFRFKNGATEVFHPRLEEPHPAS